MGENKARIVRWYFGAVASTLAVFITHPLDTIKVLLQTEKRKLSVPQIALKVIKTNGVTALYNGLSASILRQMTYSMTRFAMYDLCKDYYVKYAGYEPNFAVKIACATFSGAAGGFLSTPFDMINVRMQNDAKLPLNKRRNYKHIFNGLMHVCKEERPVKLLSGSSMATSRAVLMTVGQLSIYDQIKFMMMSSGFADTSTSHFLSSLSAGVIATTLTHPLDVLKTRKMNAKPGEFTSILTVVSHTVKLNQMGFFKGYIPAFIRVVPQTVLTFMFLERLRLSFGYLPENPNNVIIKLKEKELL